jgi:signal transduction histidine kinase
MELTKANQKIAFQNEEREKRAAELAIANKELAFQNEEKEKRAQELIIANKELVYEHGEKEKRAEELVIANKELVYEHEEKEKRAEELVIANKELVYEHKEKGKRAEELIIANKELVFQNTEKEKRANELIIANRELVFQNKEKEKRAAELILANRELVFQNEEKEKRAEELVVANTELAFQNHEKEKRAQELIIANRELLFQNDEKEKRAAELIIANRELAFQNEEKEKRAAELIIANRELAFQNGEKEKRAVELQEASRLKIDFLANMSHELRTPLNAVLGFSELMIDKKVGSLNAKQLDYLNDIHASGSHLLRLINNILDLAKIEAGKTELRIESFDMGEVIEEVTSIIQPLADKKHIQISRNLSPNIKIVRIDKNKFRQILYNLLSNAIKFTLDRGTVQVEVASYGSNTFILSVTDSGIGIAKENFSKLFIPFVQLDSGLGRHYEGSGLGLTLTKNIVKLHGGDMRVESTLGKGSTFSAVMPILYKQDQPATT